MNRIAIALVALTVAVASPAFGQGKGHDKNEAKEHGKSKEHVKVVEQHGNAKVVEHVRVENSGRVRANEHVKEHVIEHVNERGNVVTKAKVKNGAPAFCRSGAGHPVYGRSWCLQKGFGLGTDRWNRATWSDVVLQPRRASIGDVLSSVVLGRLSNYATQTLGLRAPLAGTWLLNNTEQRVYIVRSGTTPIAEMVDTNRDGRADYVLLYR